MTVAAFEAIKEQIELIPALLVSLISLWFTLMNVKDSIMILKKAIFSKVRREDVREGMCMVNELMYKQQGLIIMKV